MHEQTSFYKAPRYLFRKLNILQISKQLGVKSFVDIGCGAGELACSLAQRGIKGVGIDFSDGAIAVAEGIRGERGITPKKLQFLLGGFEVLPKQSYDIAICCEVLEHIENDKKFLRDLHKIDMKYLVLSVPARQKWFDIFDEKVGHYRRYEKDDLITLLEENGFLVKDFRAYGYPFINLTRRVRRMLSGKVKEQDTIVDQTKESGINPIKLKGGLQRIDLEPLIKPLYWFSRLFERFNISEGYLVVCEKQT